MQRMYVMVPLCQLSTNLDATSSSFIDEAAKILKVDPERIQCHQLTSNGVAIEVCDFDLSFNEISSLVLSRKKLQDKLRLYEDTLRSFDFDTPLPNQQTLIKKAKAYKSENKKLLSLLRSQLEMAERVREEYNKAIQMLKEQFGDIKSKAEEGVRNQFQQ